MLAPDELVPSSKMTVLIFTVNISIAKFIALYFDGSCADIGNISKGYELAIIVVRLMCAVAFFRNTEAEVLQAIHILKYYAKLKIK